MAPGGRPARPTPRWAATNVGSMTTGTRPPRQASTPCPWSGPRQRPDAPSIMDTLNHSSGRLARSEASQNQHWAGVPQRIRNFSQLPMLVARARSIAYRPPPYASYADTYRPLACDLILYMAGWS